MKLTKFLPLIFALVAGSLLLSACAGGAAAPASYAGMTVSQDTVFVAYNTHVYALELATGKELWRYPAGDAAGVGFYAAPSLTDDGQLILGGYDNVLYSLDPSDGSENWTFRDAKDRYIAPALVVDGRIFAANADNNLYALDSMGKLLWKFPTQGELWGKPASDPQCSCIFVVSMDHRVYAVDAQTGKEHWQTEDLDGSMIGQPAFGPEKLLYVGTFNRELLAIDASNGEVRWRVPTQGWVWGGPALVDGKLFFGDLAGHLYNLDAVTGEVLWSEQVDGPIAETPFIADQTLYFTTRNGSVYSSDFDGKNKSKTFDATLYTAPVRAGELLLLATTNNQKFIIATDLEFNEQWGFPPAEAK